MISCPTSCPAAPAEPRCHVRASRPASPYRAGGGELGVSALVLRREAMEAKGRNAITVQTCFANPKKKKMCKLNRLPSYEDILVNLQLIGRSCDDAYALKVPFVFFIFFCGVVGSVVAGATVSAWTPRPPWLRSPPLRAVGPGWAQARHLTFE